jgi:hypothetical protein
MSPNETVVTAQRPKPCAGFRVPEPHRLVPARRGELFSIGSERNRIDDAAMPGESMSPLTRREVPDLHRPQRGDCEGPAVRAEGDTEHTARLARYAKLLLARGGIKEPDVSSDSARRVVASMNASWMTSERSTRPNSLPRSVYSLY